MEEQIFEPGDRIQYRSGNPAVIHPIGTVRSIVNKVGNHHQKVIVQFGDEKPRQVYANDYRIIEKVKKRNEELK
jgi:hypothetical protein